MTEQSAYVLVPREPTSEMEHDGALAHDHPSAYMGGPSFAGRQKAVRIYRAMIAASPPAPVPDDELIKKLREIRERLAVATAASCNCGVKTFQAQYHESSCRYRVLEEADDLLMHMQRQIIGLTEQLMDAEGERAAAEADRLATRLLKRVEQCCEPDGAPDGAFSYCERCKADLDAIPARAALKGPAYDR